MSVLLSTSPDQNRPGPITSITDAETEVKEKNDVTSQADNSLGVKSEHSVSAAQSILDKPDLGRPYRFYNNSLTFDFRHWSFLTLFPNSAYETISESLEA